ncbi:MAG TPA: tetratricopeptide repeat protein, partial [Gaiellaceae bacterium]|nr:tetratricopeptide repeat protein [Gaiellaceae bacterium]
LVSAAAAALVDGSRLLDLGQHRFKDLGSPERVFQLGEGVFPAIRSLYRTNLPVPATPFLGREQELAEVVGRLGGPAVRLLTLTGPGGTGKTRLGLQAAAELSDVYPDGVYWVPLAPVRDAPLVAATIAAVLEVPEESGRALVDALASALVGRRVLLVLDNVEHLLPTAAAEVANLLAAVPTLDLLVTSRQRLDVAGEHVYPVPTLAASEAVEFFVARARAVDGSFRYTVAVDELCTRLDGLPLALELAAARVGLMTPEQLLDRLGRRLDLLKGPRDADPRQLTLRAAVAWSYDLLDPSERDVFRRLSVFAGGCTLESAEEVCEADLDLLQSLLDKSLLRRRETAQGPRLWMLETLREFAAGQLEVTGVADDAARRHLSHYSALAEDVYATFAAGGAYDLDRIESELDNLRIAFETARRTEPESALALAADLSEYWSVRGHLQEGRDRVAAALAAAPDAAAEVRVRGLRSQALIALAQSDLDTARRAFEAALAIAPTLDDRSHIGFVLNGLGIEAWYRGDLNQARQLLEAAIAAHEAAGSERGRLTALVNLGGVCLARGDHQEALELLRDAAARLREREYVGLAKVLNNLGLVEEALGL